MSARKKNDTVADSSTDIAADTPRKRSFAPVVAPHVKLLVLGSLPGELSLAQCQYYANPQNRFWRLMSEVTGSDLVGLDYAARLAALLAHGIGLWDVVGEALRDGSLDSRIRARRDNDLVDLAASLPQLRAVAFNGGTAARIGLKSLGDMAQRYRIVQLPSSSPAYTLAYAEKSAAWAVLKQCL
jgi:hypoxanthine-DNA glycosylase